MRRRRAGTNPARHPLRRAGDRAIPGVPDDALLLRDGGVLTERPAPEAGQGTLLIACGALAREIIALIDVNGLTGLTLECLPALLHNAPERIPEAVRGKIRDARARGFDRISVVYADCGTGGLLDAVCREEGVERIAGPHCYAFFDGLDGFAARQEDEFTAFFLTDFLVRQFDALIWRGMGLDRHPELRDMMFGNYDRLIYLAQTEDAALDVAAEDAAARLGLRYERRFTGYGELGDFLKAAQPAIS